VLAFYRRLIALRRTEDVLTTGTFELLAPEHPQLWAFVRADADTRVVVVANLGREPLALPAEPAFAGLDGGRLVLGNYDGEQSGPLRPWELRAVAL
jgi:glycosidase